MTNVHDVFYPSTNRLHSLVEHGEYFVSHIACLAIVFTSDFSRFSRNIWMMSVKLADETRD